MRGYNRVMLNQRHKFIAPLLFYFAVPLFIFAMLFMQLQLPGDSMLWREFQNTGHTPQFGIIALATLFISRVYIPAARDRPLFGCLI